MTVYNTGCLEVMLKKIDVLHTSTLGNSKFVKLKVHSDFHRRL